MFDTWDSNIVRLDDLMNLCATCGSFQPHWKSVDTYRQAAGHGCPNCGSLTGNTPGQVAQLIRCADPNRLRAQRLSWVNQLHRIEEQLELDRKYRNQPTEHECRQRQLDTEQYWEAIDTARTNFLASIGAVPAPIQLYALWIDTHEHNTEQPAPPQSNSDYTPTATTPTRRYPTSPHVWMPTQPFQLDEIPPLCGADAITLLIPPSIAAHALPGTHQWSPKNLGHNQLYALHRRGHRLHAWSSENHHTLRTYRDVESLRQNRRTMRHIRRQWANTSIDRILTEVA
ncbi:hypothetical protein [Mycobacteroides abscessus]|uniref:hypothetical protein n=1 Tax=Mycobacteroides abscessus TaxID=36809 RepID=UPI000379DDD0|nr:hypothetical protein [Mycobacteroides abscessus]